MAIPVKPKGLQVKTGTVQNILTWKAVTGATSYKIYRDDSPAIFASVNSPAVTYTDNVAVGERHVYTITAVNGDGASIKSYPVVATGGSETQPWPLVI